MHHGKWILASVAIVTLALSLAAAGERFDLSDGDDPFAGPNTDPAASRMPAAGALAEPNPFETAGEAKRPSQSGADPTPRRMPVAEPSDLALDVLPAPNQPLGPVPDALPLPPQAALLNLPAEAPVTEMPPANDAAATDPAATEVPAADAAVSMPEPVAAQGFAIDPSLVQSAESAGAPAVRLEWVRRTEVNVGQPCRCDLLVKNTGEAAAHDVQVQAYFPPTVRFLRETTPAPTAGPTHLNWSLGTIPAGQSRAIELHLVPSRRGELAANAFVRFTSGAAVKLEVAEPMLHVELKGPAEVQVGDPASQIIAVSNPGTGTAQNVEIRAFVPAGLEHAAGTQLALKIGSLSAGESRMVRLALAAVSGGEHVVRVVAEARQESGSEPYLRQSAQAAVRVIAPSVQVRLDGPTLRYKNREATYQVRVTNDGTAVCNNVRVVHNLPEGFEFVSAEQGGQHDSAARAVGWFVGRVEPKQSVELSVTLMASELGEQVHRVVAVSDQGTRAEADHSTVIDGVPALVLKVADQSDPVEVGAETSYEVTVRNEGTKAARNVAVTCEIPAGVEFLRAEGPTDAAAQPNAVTFAPVESLPPGETVRYRLTVRGRQDGYQRLKARVVSESVPEALSAEELTRFYGEP
jgi:uncharacterized repeat protein (TIGR01451 family)